MLSLPVRVPTLSRRQLLKIGAVALSGFDLLPMPEPKNVLAKESLKLRGTARYCVFVFLQGGASHVDSFDVKEGRWTPAATNPQIRPRLDSGNQFAFILAQDG